VGVLFEVDFEDVWGDFEVDGEAVVVGAVPWGEVLELVVVDEELRGKTIGAVFLALVEVVVSGFLVVVYGVAQFVGQGGAVLGDTHATPGADRSGLVVIVAFRPARVAYETYTELLGVAMEVRASRQHRQTPLRSWC